VPAAATRAGRLLTGWLLDRFHAPRVAFAMPALAALERSCSPARARSPRDSGEMEGLTEARR